MSKQHQLFPYFESENVPSEFLTDAEGVLKSAPRLAVTEFTQSERLLWNTATFLAMIDAECSVSRWTSCHFSCKKTG